MRRKRGLRWNAPGHFCWWRRAGSGWTRPPTEPAKVGDVDVEAFSHNLARLIEEGGKALAAYMKPREEGKVRSDLADDVTDAVKTVGRVAEYWMSDPQRAIELQTSLGRAYLDLWAGAVKRMAGEQPRPWQLLIRRTSAFPTRNGRKISSSIS